MARDDVNIKVSADVAEAIRMWRAMQQGPEAMANALEATGKRGRAAASGMEVEFGKLVGRWTSIAGGIAAAKLAIDQLIASQREYNRLVKDASVPTDTLARQFGVQGGLTNQQIEAAKASILNIARQRAVAPTTAFGAATQMVSSGFTPEQVVEGGGLNEFLKLLNATNATGRNVDPVEMAKSMSLFLEASRQEKSGENVRALSREIQGLFKGTNLQTGDLALFSKEAGKIAQFFPELQNKQLALLSQFEGVTDTASAGTSLRAALSNIRTAGATPEKVAALKSIGVTPQQVDDETFLQVQDVLTKALARSDSVTRNIAAKRLFGDEGSLAAGVLFTPQGQAVTRERFAMGASEAAFRRDVAITEGSLEAKARRSEASAAAAFADAEFLDPTTVRREMIAEMQRRGSSRFSQSMAGIGFDKFHDWIPGADAESAIRMTFPGLTNDNVDFRNEVLERSRSQMPADLPPQRIEVRVELTDQDAVAIPHKSDVSRLNQAK